MKLDFVEKILSLLLILTVVCIYLNFSTFAKKKKISTSKRRLLFVLNITLIVSFFIIGSIYYNFASSFSTSFDVLEYNNFKTQMVNNYELGKLKADAGRAGDILFYVYTKKQLSENEQEQIGLDIKNFLMTDSSKTEIVEKYYKNSAQFGTIRVLFYTNSNKKMHYDDLTHYVEFLTSP